MVLSPSRRVATRYSTGTLGTDRKFTGQRLDGTGLYFYNARYSDASIGRFVSADTMVHGSTAPQGLNRYAYVLNNPLRFTDPTGFLPTADEIAGADSILSNPGPCFGGECFRAVTWAVGIRRQADAVNSVQAIVGQTPVAKAQFAGADLGEAPGGIGFRY